MKLIIAVLIIIIMSACQSGQNQTNTATNDVTGTAEKNKELVKRVYTEMANKQNYALIDSFFATNIYDHGALPGQEQNLAGFKKAVIDFLGMFSYVEITPEYVIAEGDMIATKETWKVIRKSDKKELKGDTMHWFRIKDGKITDEWSKGWEWLGL